MTIDRYKTSAELGGLGIVLYHTPQEDGEWVKYEDHIELLKKIMIFYGLPPDKRDSAKFLGLAHLFKEMDDGTTQTHQEAGEGDSEDQSGQEEGQEFED